MADLSRLHAQLQKIDRQLAQHRGPASEKQADLLRLRRETILAIKDQSRAIWGD